MLTSFKELAFAVSGSQLQRAIVSLEGEGLSLCRDRSCPLNISSERGCPRAWDNPSAHFHMGVPDTSDFSSRAWNALQLFTIEDVLWELPIIERGVNYVDGVDGNVIFANDISQPIGSELKGFGRFPDSISGVRVPTWPRYIEALILLTLGSLKCNEPCSGWFKELGYMAAHGDPHRLGHPAFTRFFLDMFRSKSPFKAVVAEALEVLGPRLHIPRLT